MNKWKDISLDTSDMDVPTYHKAIIEAMQKAECEAIKNGIETNTIVLSPKYAITKNFYLQIIPGHIFQYPPMLLGKAVILEDMLPDDTAFALMKTIVKKEEDWRSFLKKYVKTDGKSLRFKNISFKKNPEDFQKILEILGGE